MNRYSALIVLTEEDVLFLILIADALDEIGAQAQAEAIRAVTSKFERVK